MHLAVAGKRLQRRCHFSNGKELDPGGNLDTVWLLSDACATSAVKLHRKQLVARDSRVYSCYPSVNEQV